MDGIELISNVTRTGRRISRHQLPAISPVMVRWFLAYARNYARRNFHALRVAEEQSALAADGRPLLIYMNHPSWWDPILSAVLCSQYFRNYCHYSPIDSEALKKYKFFAKLGFFGVTRNDNRSARRLLEIGSKILTDSQSALWITPQARFADVRERPLQIGTVVAHLAKHSRDCVVLPLAIEYVFWEEKTPEALVRFGRPITGGKLQEASSAPAFFEAALSDTMNALAEDSIRRNASHFRVILSGKAGVGGVYDVWRRLKANLRGESFRAEHRAQ